ncbi:Rossmann-like and DUF2520 domain-containing protein [Patiriisocius marinus]|uniref:DUF2520 domain-containing protein n=1 Tax=Patiriisocius marinus TaxID=1397112 RepID=A0A5J4IWG3_9FLAO|nr:Rossmann-like and DUF2520 domain-containing protein [Patiriisocius marinus]GER59216.1 hypothetical protein ULMA_13240 [Patiriisocius marinus]
MIDVVLIGHGNVGSHLARVFTSTKGINLIQVFSTRKFDNVNPLESIRIVDLAELNKTAEVYIVAVPDDAISKVSNTLSLENKLVVHTSGSVSMNEISSKHRRGVFYPLQTFSKGTTVDFSEIPVCLEAENKQDLNLLKKLGHLVSKNVSEISSKERSEMHVAAVFVNNFVNELYHISEDIMKEHNLDFKLFKPLIKETANKVQSLSPASAQTGPAKRNDKKTIERHLGQLKNKDHKEIYELLTKSIINRRNND